MEEIFKLNFLSEINYIRLVIDIIILFICSRMIEYVYNKYIYSNDNKFLFTKHMFPFILAMFLIVSVIKTSIALSLGLVGALSIIRFRTAIKEPGQLISLLILTSLSISFAAEKEVLGILITIVYLTHTVFSNNLTDNKNQTVTPKKILRISIKETNLELNKIIKINNFERIYKDVNNLIQIEFFISTEKDEMNSILQKIKTHGKIITYEVF
jgi:hypothetical protein